MREAANQQWEVCSNIQNHKIDQAKPDTGRLEWKTKPVETVSGQA
jgi:hypothetical protein